MIYSSVGLDPSNKAIDPSISNIFSWVNRGSPQTDYQLQILNNDTSALVYDSTKITSSNSYHTVPSSSLVAGTNYKWNITTWFNTEFSISQYAFIAVNSAPTLVFTDPDFTSPPVILSGQSYLFKALYSQAESISISKYRFILYDVDDNIITDTGYIYGFTPEYEFTGMLRATTYKILAMAISQNDLSCTTGVQEFSIASYIIPNTVPAISVVANNSEAAIDISWADLKIVTPVIIGTYSYVAGKFNEGVLLDDGTTLDYQETVTPNNNIVSGWYQFTYGQDGDFIQLGDHVWCGFDSATQRFYVRNDSIYTYSQQFGLYNWENFGSTTWADWSGNWINPGFDPTELTANWFFIAVNNTKEMTIYFNDVLAFVFSSGVSISDSFASIKFTGKILLDNMRANNKSMTLAEINTIPKTTPQLWGTDTNWLANFDNSLEGGNIDNSIPIIGWRLKRRKLTDDLFVTMRDFAKETREFTDRTPVNNTEYIYSVYSLSAEGEGLGLEGNATVNFFGWYLIDNATGAWFKFDAGWDGLETDEIQTIQDIYIYKNFSKKPVVSYGAQDYRQGKITAVPYLYTDCNLVINKPTLDSLRLFITNKTSKILKNSFGDILIVNTYEFKSKFQDKISAQPYQISFNWIETEEYEENTQLPYGNESTTTTPTTTSWNSWSPTLIWDTALAGNTIARYAITNNTVFFNLYFNTSNGNNATSLTFDLPIPPKTQITKTNTSISEIMNNDHVFGSSCEINYTNTSATVQSLSGESSGSPYELIVSGSYEI